MPRREDEYWAAKKEPRGRGLCPRCGSSNLSYNKKFQSWRCNKCEHSFPIPSYGPGGDFGKEARWLGKTTEELRRDELAEARAARRVESSGRVNNTNSTPSGKAWFGNEYYDTTRSKKWKRPKGSSFPMKKAFLVLLVIACLAAVGWTGYLLLTDKTDPISGSIILVANIGVLFWNISVLRKYRVGAGTIISIFLVIVLLGATVGAFAGVEPLSTYKDNIFSSISQWGKGIPTINIQSPVNVVKREYLYNPFLGTGSIKIYIEPTKATEADKIYVILLYKRDTELGTRYVKWDGLELHRLTVKTTTFYIPESDYEAYFKGKPEEQISSVFKISVREATAGESYLINENYPTWDSYFAK